MAKGNIFLGQSAGKIGDVVLYRNAGQQQARAHVANPRNPKTYKQAQRRSRYASAVLAYQLFKNIVDKSGKYSDGRTMYNYFIKNNIDIAPYVSKEEKSTWTGSKALPAPWVLSRGIFPIPNGAGTAIPVINGTTSIKIGCGTVSNMLSTVISYLLENGKITNEQWAAAVSSSSSITLFIPDVLEALAGGPDRHLCYMCTQSANLEEGIQTRTVASYPLRVVELLSSNFDETDTIEVYKDASTGRIICDSNFVILIGNIGVQFPNTETADADWYIEFMGNYSGGAVFSGWVASNDGYEVNTSDIICNWTTGAMDLTYADRRNISNLDTDAVIRTWQDATSSANDSKIYS